MKKILLALLVLAVIAAFPPVVAGQGGAAFKVEVVGKGKPLLLIPGLGCSGEVWKETVARYSGSYQCHIFTLAGFAGVPALEQPLLKAAGAGIRQYVREQKLNKPVIMGHSIGGYLALQLASAEPELFAKVLVVDALPFFPATFSPPVSEDSMRKAPVEAMVRQSQRLSAEQFSYYQRYTLSTMISDAGRVEQALQWSLASDRATLVRAAFEMMQEDLRDDISRIKVPVLVLGSYFQQDKGQNRQHGQQTFQQQYAQLKGVQIEVNTNARHFLMYDDPDWFFSSVDGFLGKKK